MDELLFTEAFSEYRQHVINAVHGFIRGLWKDDVNTDYVRGAMKMAEKVFMIPLEYKKKYPKEMEAQLKKMVAADLTKFEMRLLRKTLDKFDKG